MLMNNRDFGGRALRWLGSLRLSVLVMVTIGSICAFATFYEMRQGTPAVQRDIYQTSWFAVLLGLLGFNVLAAMLSRWPWSKHHVGFLLAHLGILLVLTGSLVSLYRGLDSNMALYEGETSDRVTEVIGSVRQTNRNETSVDHDRKMRTFGFYRAAQRTASRLDPETVGLLQAYCDGVNAYFREHQDRLHPLFAQTGLQPEPWTPADCLASWWHLGQFFAGDGTRDLIAGRNEAAGQKLGRPVRGQVPGRGEGRPGERPVTRAELKPMPPDDRPAGRAPTLSRRCSRR